jgi:hypothetical protein
MGPSFVHAAQRIGRWEGLPEWKTPSTSLSQVWNTRYGTSILCLDLRQTYGTWHGAPSWQASSIVQRRLRLRKRSSSTRRRPWRWTCAQKVWAAFGVKTAVNCHLFCLLLSGARQGPGQRGLGASYWWWGSGLCGAPSGFRSRAHQRSLHRVLGLQVAGEERERVGKKWENREGRGGTFKNTFVAPVILEKTGCQQGAFVCGG